MSATSRTAAAAKASDRLFFAVRPDAAATSRIADLAQALRRRHGLRGRLLDPARLHITLCFLGDYPELPRSVVERATRSAAAIAAPSFEVALDTVHSFPRRRHRPLVLGADSGADSLRALRQALAAGLRAVGLVGRERRRFQPHLTLLYDDRGVARQAVDPIAWTVREFLLMHSLIGKGEHRVLERFALGR